MKEISPKIERRLVELCASVKAETNGEPLICIVSRKVYERDPKLYKLLGVKVFVRDDDFDRIIIEPD